jgi:hypothetical protein
MSGEEMSETVKTVIERWGFPTLVALACMYVIRADVLQPLVEQHAAFLKTIGESQKEISAAVREQTQLLYALKPELRQQFKSTVDIKEPQSGAN